jgi:hypothetical protein
MTFDGDTKISDYIHYIKDFEFVESVEWTFLTQGTRICYLRTDGKFVKGGYIQSISYTNDTDGNQTFYFTLNPIIHSNTARPWNIYQNNIAKLWKKRQNIDQIVESTPQQQYVTIEEYNDLKTRYDEYFRHVKADYQKLNNDMIEIVKVIKYFHPKHR